MTRGHELTEQVVVRLSPDLLGRLKSRAESDERTIAQTMRLAIKEYLAAEDRRTA